MRLRAITTLAGFLFLIGPTCLIGPIAAAGPAAPGEWPAFRANSSLDGHTDLKGRIDQPHVAWTRTIGLMESQSVLHPPSEAAGPPPPTGNDDPAWYPALISAEAGGRQTLVENSTNVTYADVFPDTPGWEKLEFESGFDKPAVNNQWQPCVGRCFVWKDGQWTVAWESEPIEMLFQAMPIVGDFDHDGGLEVVVLPWNELLVLDATTGKIEDRCTFTEGRSYGALHARDLDEDGLTEFVVIADFVKHIDVLGYREGKLSLFWRRDVEHALEHSTKMLRAHPHAVADVTGDGRSEVLVSIFNDTGDRKWHVLVLEGLTGQVMADFPDELLQGVADANADGSSDLFTSVTRDVNLPDYSTVFVRALNSDAPRVLWQADPAGWEIAQPPTPLHVSTAATRGRDDALVRVTADGSYAAVRRIVDNRRDLSVLATTRDKSEIVATACGPAAQAIAVHETGSLLFRTRGQSQEQGAPVAERGTLAAVGTYPIGLMGWAAPIVFREAGGPPVIAVQDPAEQIVLLEGRPEGEPQELRRIPGRGQAVEWANTCGPVAADLAGDGSCRLLLSGAAPDGSARFSAVDFQGRELWHHDFPQVPGTAPVWNTGGIIFWHAGHFTNPDTLDVLVQVRRTIMHTEEAYLLSGRDGHEIWHRPTQISGRGVGGQPFAVADLDGDSLDDAVSFHPSLFYILNGATGADVIAKDALWDAIPLKPVYWGAPTTGHFDDSGKTGIFLHSTHGGLAALLRPNDELVWGDVLDEAASGYPAFGRFDDSGRMRAMVLGASDGLRCYDTATGKVLWRLPLPGTGTSTGSATADIDSDGRDEALFVFADTLYCIEAAPEGDAGRITWQLPFPATLGPPAIADVHGQGQASILVAGVDGILYGIE